MRRQNENGKQDNFKKNELMNDYNEYFTKIFLNLEKKKKVKYPHFQTKKTKAEEMYKMKVHMSKRFLN